MPYDQRRTTSVFIDVVAGNPSSELIAFERPTAPVAWADAEVERLFHCRQVLGWDWGAIARELGRTESGVKSKFKYVQNDRLIKSPSVPFVREPIPADVLREQARRLSAPFRDLAGAVFGDPPWGHSALDRRVVA